MKNLFSKFFVKVLLFMIILSLVTISGNLLSFAAEEEAPYAISVTFNGDPHTQKGFTWNTSTSSTDSTIQYLEKKGDTPNFSGNIKQAKGTVSTVGARNVHKVLLTGLEPGKAYWYRVGDSINNIWSQPGVFTTEPANSGSYTALVFTDTQFRADNNYAEAAPAYVCLRNAFNAFPDAAFALHVGDMVDQGSNEALWTENFRLGQDFYSNFTFAPVTGNHDSGSHGMYHHFNLALPEGSDTEKGVYYSFDYGDVHYIVLSTNDGSGYHLSEEQRNWFMADAAATDKKFKVLSMHVPVYSGGSKPTENQLFFRDYFPKMIYEAGIDVVFMGHDHVWTRTKLVKDIPNTPTIIVTENKYNGKINGEDFPITVNPDGVYYQVLASSGARQWAPSAAYSQPMKHFFEVNKSAGGGGIVQGFAKITVEGNRLGVICYNHNINTGAITVVDKYAITKVSEPDSVIKAINELPASVALSHKTKIEAVRKDYNALSDAQKAIVTNYDKLTAAEAALEALKSGGSSNESSADASGESSSVISNVTSDESSQVSEEVSPEASSEDNSSDVTSDVSDEDSSAAAQGGNKIWIALVIGLVVAAVAAVGWFLLRKRMKA